MPSLTRRAFIRGVAGWASLAYLVSCTATTRKVLNNEPDAEDGLHRIVDRFGISLQSEFSAEEIKDISDVLSAYSSMLGDLKRFGLSFKKFQFNSKHYETDGIVHGFYTPLSGFPAVGQIDIYTAEIFLAPREIVNRNEQWKKDPTKQPGDLGIPIVNGRSFPIDWNYWGYQKPAQGEEGRVHDYKWVAAHEIAHAISFKEKYGNDWLNNRNKNKTTFYERWNALSKEIKEKCKELPKDEKQDWIYERPEGYPTFISYFSNEGEAFADTTAYMVTGSHYADHDTWLMKRLELLENEFGRIRELN